MIWDKDPHAILGLLGLRVGRRSFSSTSLSDLGCLRAEVEDQGYQGRDVAGELQTGKQDSFLTILHVYFLIAPSI
jgi:hypothetical protein